MNRNSKRGDPDEVIQTVCVSGIFIIDKRMGYDRRRKAHKCKKEYERRFNNWLENFNRRRQLINLFI